MQGNREPKEHSVQLYLHPKIQLALIKFMADVEQGKSYAVLTLLVDGLHKRGYLDDRTAHELTEKYSVKLVKPETELELSPQAAREIASMTQLFRDVLDQWKYHKDGDWRAKWVKKAREYENRVPNARYIIALAEKGE